MIKKEVAIIGGGPAGLAAAVEAAKFGAKVLVIDENKRPGGQLFKQIHKFFGSKAHDAGIRGIDIGMKLLRETEESGVEVWLDSAAIGVFSGKRIAVLRNNSTEVIEAERILLSTGGAENALNFPGWTLPGVMGAGAAQTMINVNRVLPGKKVLMIGAGNVGVIVAYQLLQAGAEVVGIMRRSRQIEAYGVHAAKIRRAGVPFYLGHTIVEARGTDRVESVVIAEIRDGKFIPGTEKEAEADTICLSVGLRPLSELAYMAGVHHEYVRELGGWMPVHNRYMESSVPGIYVAGDIAGVEEANTAMDEGRLAGVAIAHSLGYISDEKAKTLMEEIDERLLALRLGPFGLDRQKAKERIIERGGVR